MVKAYLRYEAGSAFGVIASLESNICYDGTGKILLAPALESVGVWNVRQGVCSRTLSPSASSRRGPSLAVTSIAASPSSSSSVKNPSPFRTCETTLNGHKGAVTALCYNKAGSMLASGSKDNDIILWDVVGESGLFRLRGHRDQVTDLVFIDSGKKLVSCSKDKFVRVWDIDTQHCMQIISGHHSEIWSMDVDQEERYLVTGSADLELRFYEIKHELHPKGINNGEDSSKDKWEVLKHFGEIQRQSKDRVATLRFNKSGNLLACQVAGKTIEIFRVLDEFESKRKAKRRIHRKREKISAKLAAEAVGGGGGDVAPQEVSVPGTVVSDVFKFLQVLRTSKKICSFSFCPTPTKGALATLALSMNNNLLEIYSIQDSAATKTLVVDLPGHRSDVRSVSLSSDNTLLMSTSHNAVKIWNPSTGACLRTIESGYGLCCSFVPGNRYALVGTKSGALEIIDVGSGSCTETVEAHAGAVRSIASIPNGSGFITGSADHEVKFWEYQLMEVDSRPWAALQTDVGSKQLTVTNWRTLKMNDDVLVVAISLDSKYVAISLLDCTVKVLGRFSWINVFFLDSLKFFLSLYGHKLPVLCLDISSDGNLIVSGSADKNMKIWGLDFGDCHKSIFAHADSVMAVQFVHNTHYVFSVGKDRLVKYWDADKFELLLTLEGHHAEIWCLSVSNRGDFIVTGSHDRSIRRWDRTEEPFFLEEEKEKRLEEMFESAFDDSFENKYALKEEVPEEGAVGLAGKKTQETLTATDLIIDALIAAEEESKRIDQHKEEKQIGGSREFQPNVMMLGLSPSDFVLRALSNVHTNDLEQTLLSLPFADALKLMSYLKDWIPNPDKVELVCRVAVVLLQTHHNQLIATPAARTVLSLLKDILYKKVKECKDILGFNLAAMDHLKQLMSLRSDAPFRDAKAKLLEIRSQQLKRVEGRNDPKDEKQKKKQKRSRGRSIVL
ncbi:Dip2/Utp12 protein [Asimina triloba]